MIKAGQPILAADLANALMSVVIVTAPGQSTYLDTFGFITGATTEVQLSIDGYGTQRRTLTSDWAAVDEIHFAALSGAYLYLLLWDLGTTAYRVYRYDKTNLAAGGTLMTISGQAFGANPISGGFIDQNGVWYFTGKAGNSASLHVISKYTLSGTTLTYTSDVTCGATSANFTDFGFVDVNGNIYGSDGVGNGTTRKYNSSGTLQWTSAENIFPISVFYTLDKDKLYALSAASNPLTLVKCYLQ